MRRGRRHAGELPVPDALLPQLVDVDADGLLLELLGGRRGPQIVSSARPGLLAGDGRAG